MIQNSKVFNDAVHGSIEVHPLAVKIMDTPQFQRLRFIKQVGTVYFVYPSASHNRFEHSLGVYHLAGQFVEALKVRQPELKITEKDVLCVEIAGLCHDLGHGPFSHLWEEFVHKKRPDRKWQHEEASVKMLEHLIKVNQLEEELRKYDLENQDILFIKELISSHKILNENPNVKWPYKGRTEEKGFLYQIVANWKSGVDVDKWDYFLRDSHSLGLQVAFKYSRLVKFSRVIRRDSAGLEICFRDKEVTNIYDMFYARMMLHKKAYQHKVAKVIDTIQLLPLCDVIDDMEAMTYLHDDVIHQIYRSSSDEQDMKRARRIIHNLLTRRYYPYVGISSPSTKPWTLEGVKEKMKSEVDLKVLLEGTSDDLQVRIISLNYSKGNNNPVSKVGFFTRENPDEYQEHRPENTSKLFPLQWEERIILAMYRGDDEDVLLKARKAFSRLFD